MSAKTKGTGYASAASSRLDCSVGLGGLLIRHIRA